MVIALLTDFGTKDYFVGAMKGVILSINPQAKIIDITHEIEPQNIHSAGFILASCYQNFPSKTIFVSVIDPGVGSTRRAIFVETQHYYFIAPDNGLLSLVLANEKEYQAVELTNPEFFNQPVSNTFHGRDIFAPVAAWISKGTRTNKFGNAVSDIVLNRAIFPLKISENEIEGQIIHIDNFGNLITNFKKSDLEENFALVANGQIISNHHSFYAKAEKGEIFSIFGSAGYLEIAAYCSSAKDLLKIKIGAKIKVLLQ